MNQAYHVQKEKTIKVEKLLKEIQKYHSKLDKKLEQNEAQTNQSKPNQYYN